MVKYQRKFGTFVRGNKRTLGYALNAFSQFIEEKLDECSKAQNVVCVNQPGLSFVVPHQHFQIGR